MLEVRHNKRRPEPPFLFVLFENQLSKLIETAAPGVPLVGSALGRKGVV